MPPVFSISTKEGFSNFVQNLADAYRKEMEDHGYLPPPYEAEPGNHVCCVLPMMWAAFEAIGVIEQNADQSDFEMHP